VQVRDDELRRLLALANPWWSAVASGGDRLAWTETHRLLAHRRSFDLGYRASVLDDIATGDLGDSLVVLNGPRRVGKSVAMLDAIATMCARDDIDPRQLIHVPCDGMADRDLRRAITLGRSLTVSVDSDGPCRRAWFFDEISDISGWTGVLKQARDLSSFGDDTVIATGSRWTSNASIFGNLMAGRAGTSGRRRIRQLLPMSFRDFLIATAPHLPLLPPMHPAALQSSDALDALRNLEYMVDDYDLTWQNYLTSGGFPRAVAEHTKNGGVSTAFTQDLLGWLSTDVDPDGSPESIPLLLAEIAERSSSPLNVRSMSAALGYGSRNTLDRRITKLVASHAALRCHRRNDQGRSVPGAQYKLYLVDPLLAWAPTHASPGLPEPDFTRLNENALAIGLARRINDLDEGRWSGDDTIGYLRSASGTEVDLAPVRVPTSSGPATTTPIESKWVDARWKAEAKIIRGQYGRGILATKSVLDLDSPVWAVPAPLVALLLE